jgi:hypothetical protein
MARKKLAAQASGPRGLRWLAVYVGKRSRIVWADNAFQAGLVAELYYGKPERIEPAPADYRNASRGGSKTRRIGLRMTDEQLAELHRRYGPPGTFTANILKRLLTPSA